MCAVMGLRMHYKHSVCRNAQLICKMPLWLVTIAGLRKGYIFKEKHNLASLLPFSHCGNTSFAREIFSKGRTFQEQLDAKADECLLLSCFEVVLAWISQIEKVSVVISVSKKHKNYLAKGRYTHLLGNRLAPSSKFCSLTAATPLSSKASL